MSNSSSGPLTGMRACLIVDGDKLPQYAYDAIALAVAQGLEIVAVLICENTHYRRRLRNSGYYLFAALFLRIHAKKERSWSPLVAASAVKHPFDSEWEGAWQRVPPKAQRVIARASADVVLRFGMNLLRDPDELPARFGVLSYHHGDPSDYRGRPAAFYEVLYGETHVGMMIQRLSNSLDAGRILAYGEVKMSSFSYRRTLERLYSHSSYLLTKALTNLQEDRFISRETSGKNRTIPSNGLVLRLAFTLVARKLRRWLYGAFWEKRWRVGVAERPDLSSIGDPEDISIGRTLDVPDGYTFLADPAVISEGLIAVEGMETRRGVGRILTVSDSGFSVIDTEEVGKGHLSYPHIATDCGITWLLPEMAQVGPQRIFRLDSGRIVESRPMLGLEHLRLIDPTLLNYCGAWWLFAGTMDSSLDVLNLWSAESLFGPYTLHRESPIVLSPKGARMAGPVQLVGDRIFRLGQDNRAQYGDGLVVFEVLEITPDRYLETLVGSLQVTAPMRGPHTAGFWGDVCVVDFYVDRLALLAGWRRLRAKLKL